MAVTERGGRKTEANTRLVAAESDSFRQIVLGIRIIRFTEEEETEVLVERSRLRSELETVFEGAFRRTGVMQF